MIRFYINLFLVMPESWLKWLIFFAYGNDIYLDIYIRDCCDRMEYYGTSSALEAFADDFDDIDDLYYIFSKC
ncbi:MAG: hypothetical protein IM537_05875 [Pseudanabaena sp. M57BS1SP1A06MG]|nr:hypothetical protein [Pseudanabaena sp. M34BS1SP1A06MG]MCA6599737.1 hypothetical protein [Pseudanabaena sp. M57BS1SP1A06MG]